MRKDELLVTAWWFTESGAKLHVTDLIKEPELRRKLPLLDQLALDIELVEAGLERGAKR